VPPKQNIVIPSALAANKTPVSTAASKSTSTPSYQTGSNNTTAAAEKPKIPTFTPTSTLPRITAPVKAYDFSVNPVKTTDVKTEQSANGSKSITTKDIINSKLVIKDSTTPSKSGMAATLNKISSSTGLETVQLVGGSANLIKPGSVVSINKSTNTQYNSTSKLNTSANQKEILKNVEAVKSAGLNTVLIQAYSDSTGKSDYNLGLSQARANEDLKNYALTMEKNGYSSKDGQWKDATGKVVPASKCTSFCSFTKTGETTPSIQLAAQGLGEVTKKTAGPLGEAQKKIEAAGCANIRTGKCGAMHDAQRVSLIGGVLDSTLINTTKKATGCTVEPCTTQTPPPPPPPSPSPTCKVACGPPPPPQCLNPLGCDPTPPPRPTPTPTPTPSATPTPVDPTAVVDLRTTTSRLPSSGGVGGGSSTASGTPSTGASTTGSGSTAPTTSTPSSGLTGSAGSSSTGSTLLPPAAGLGGASSGGTLGATPSAPTGGSPTNPTSAPKFKVS
jgi:outer membrane protein OmpA-like peptidoglycan-associated protein